MTERQIYRDAIKRQPLDDFDTGMDNEIDREITSVSKIALVFVIFWVSVISIAVLVGLAFAVKFLFF